MRNWFAYPLMLSAALLCAMGCKPAGKPPEEGSQSGPRSIFALGTLQPASGVISITGTPGDRLKAIDPDVVENQLAPANGLLGVLSSYDARLAQLDALRTRKLLAKDKQDVDLLLARAQLRGAKAQVKEAQARLAEASLQGEQVKHLVEAAAIAQDELDSIIDLRKSDPDLVTEHQVRKQRNRVARAKGEVKLAKQRVKPLTEAAQAALEAAQANQQAAEVSVESLKQRGAIAAIEKEIAVAEQALGQSIIWAPGADASGMQLGTNPAKKDDSVERAAASDSDNSTNKPTSRYTVLKVFTRPGEMVSQLPVMQLGDVSRIECVAEVYEADAQAIRIGQGATITSPALSDSFEQGLRGKVTYVARLISSPGLDARNPLAPKDRSVVEVRISLDTDDSKTLAEAAKRIGLQVNVKFDAEK